MKLSNYLILASLFITVSPLQGDYKPYSWTFMGSQHRQGQSSSIMAQSMIPLFAGIGGLVIGGVVCSYNQYRAAQSNKILGCKKNNKSVLGQLEILKCNKDPKVNGYPEGSNRTSLSTAITSDLSFRHHPKSIKNALKSELGGDDFATKVVKHTCPVKEGVPSASGVKENKECQEVDDIVAAYCSKVTEAKRSNDRKIKFYRAAQYFTYGVAALGGLWALGVGVKERFDATQTKFGK